MEMQNKENQFLIPTAIIIAGIFIAGAIYFGGSTDGSTSLLARNDPNQQELSANAEVKPVTSDDHIRGDINAKVIVVEYTDFECPFCKVFHTTMNQILDTYKPEEVAFVYRHFPIAQLHSKAPKEAEASECVTELGGNEAFWKFADKIFETTNSNDSLDPSELPIIASAAGVDTTAFNNCLSSGKYTKRIEDAVKAAARAGAQGTPYSVAIAKNGQKIVINGAQPFQTVKNTIDALLQQ